MVVHAREVVEIRGAAEAAQLRVGPGVADALEAGHERGARAHRAGYLGHVERGALEAPVAELRGRLREREHFAVSGGVVGALDSVVAGRQDLATELNDGANGHLVLTPGVDSLI